MVASVMAMARRSDSTGWAPAVPVRKGAAAKVRAMVKMSLCVMFIVFYFSLEKL